MQPAGPRSEVYHLGFDPPLQRPGALQQVPGTWHSTDAQGLTGANSVQRGRSATANPLLAAEARSIHRPHQCDWKTIDLAGDQMSKIVCLSLRFHFRCNNCWISHSAQTPGVHPRLNSTGMPVTGQSRFPLLVKFKFDYHNRH